MRFAICPALVALVSAALASGAEPPKTDAGKAPVVVVGKSAPDFKVKTADGLGELELSKIIGKGPVLVRLTCACSGCDAELPSFLKLQAAYKDKGLVTVAIFKDNPALVAKYAKEKTPEFVGGLDAKGDLWKVFETTAMPTNILIDKDGKIVSIAKGCTKDGTIAEMLSNMVAKMVKSEPVSVKPVPAGK